MNLLEITATQGDEIDFAPSSIQAEIIQNIRCILTTAKRTVPLDRGFGLTNTFLDQPTPKAQAEITVEIITLIEEYEPRVTVSAINFTADTDGRMVAKVQVAINDN